jgi:hypothetical protein
MIVPHITQLIFLLIVGALVLRMLALEEWATLLRLLDVKSIQVTIAFSVEVRLLSDED